MASEARPFVRRGFWLTLFGLVLVAELLLRLAPHGPPRVFRALYGNTLSMYMAIADRLERRAPDVRLLALGDSLTMTQFQPDAFADAAELPAEAVFNAGYLGMSFPSQEALLRTIGRERLPALERVLFFVNPRRLSPDEEPNTEIFRVADPGGYEAAREAWSRRKLAPVLDHSRLYGLSRHLVLYAWRSALRDPPSWDQVERLQPQGGARWDAGRPSADPPRYPYPRLETVSPERLAEMEAVLELLAEWGVRTTLLISPIHPSLDPFASDAARAAFDATLAELATRHDAVYAPGIGERFTPADERDYCDYGHMNWSGATAYSRALARHRDELLAKVTR